MTRCTRVPTKNMRTSMDRSASHQQTPRLPHTCRGRGLASALGLIVTLWSLAAYSEGFRNPPPGAFNLGRAGGRIAHIDDSSAVHHNPANLVDIATSELNLSPYSRRGDSKILGFRQD